ncbi:hypothetical protein Bhyg_17746 [Pseudolycoriella hygida]|uniref:Uncharacterized protein n=1 Tax=Pseudolycoriella hygida TaxID=35572 RepID=A0A9Q0MKV2_9DIPT|nr:hypothetical protein Bhyg_17746 [Pseudolycoriella hygida]
MSSSASTGVPGVFTTIRLTTYTTSFERDDKDGLPSYSQAVGISPLLHEASPGTVFGTETCISFEHSSSSTSEYGFLIRDSFGCLQAKGEVNHYDIRLQHVNGTEMLRISGQREERNVFQFQVSHKNKSIGSVTVREQGPPETSLKINHNNAFPEIVARSLVLGDFAIPYDYV